MEEGEGEIINFDRICRLCLHEKLILTEIFESATDSNSLTIDQKITACATIDLCKDDGLPTRICIKCLANLNAAFDFRIQCESADKTLHRIRNVLLDSDTENNQDGSNMNESLGKLKVKARKEEKTTEDLGSIIVIKNQQKGIAMLEESDDLLYILKEVEDDEKPQETWVDNCVIYHNNGVVDNQEFYSEEQETSIEALNEISSAVNESDIKTLKVVTNSSANMKETGLTRGFFNENENSLSDVTKSPCPFCNKMLTRVDEHIRLLHRNRVYVCTKLNCGAKFSTLKNLQSHQLQCFNIKKAYKCPGCNKDFHRKSNFKAHVKRHADKKEFQCQFCGRAFVDSTGLRRHILKHHEPEKEVFTSGCCGKRFKSKEGLKKHIQKSICGVQIFQGPNLKSDRLKETDSKISSLCNSCNSSSNENNNDNGNLPSLMEK